MPPPPEVRSTGWLCEVPYFRQSKLLLLTLPRARQHGVSLSLARKAGQPAYMGQKRVPDLTLGSLSSDARTYRHGMSWDPRPYLRTLGYRQMRAPAGPAGTTGRRLQLWEGSPRLPPPDGEEGLGQHACETRYMRRSTGRESRAGCQLLALQPSSEARAQFLPQQL